MQILLSKGFLTGLMFFGFGALALVLGTRLPTGTALEMGPGYVPRLFSTALIGLGALIAIKAVIKGSEPLGSLQAGPILSITSGIVAFALLIEPAGFFPAGLVMLALAAYAGHEFNVKEALLTMIVLLVACSAIFKFGLGLSFSLIQGVW